MDASRYNPNADSVENNATLRPVNDELQEALAQRTAELDAVRKELQQRDAQIQALREASEQSRRELLEILEAGKKTEETLWQSSQMLKLILDSMPAFVFWKDRNSVYLGCNDRFASNAGLGSPENIIGLTDLEMPWTRNEAEAYRADDKRIMESGIPKINYEETQHTADGRTTWVRTSKIPLKDSKGEVIGVLGTFEDFTQRKEAEERLRKEAIRSKVLLDLYESAPRLTDRELYDFALDHAVQVSGSKIGFFHFVSDDQKTILLTTWNQEALKNCSVSSDTHYPLDVAGNWADCVRLRRPLVYNDFAHSPRQKGLPEGHTPLQRFMSVPVLDGEKVRIIFGVGNKETNYDELDAIHMQLVANELQKILQQREADAALKKAKEAAENANEAKDQFLAVLSHELRTPLTPVLATVSALQCQEEINPGELRSDLDLIRRNMEMEARLIDDLLDVTKIARGKLELRREMVDAHELLRTALAICQKDIQSKQIEVSLQFRARARFFRADPTRMRQVFWNLIKNAAEYTPDRGRIDLRTSDAGDRLKVEIEDTGVGIRPELLPRIFTAFERGDQSRPRRFGGLGLGLSIAQAVVRMHEGTIEASSEGEGKGARFTVELPAVAQSFEQSQPAPSAARPEEKIKILLVDDHPDTLLTLAKLLRRAGHTVQTADSIGSAKDVAKENGFDLLISDLGLPDGSGMDLMRELKLSCNIRGIALSGFGTEEDIRECRNAGFEEHLTKPVSLGELRNAISRVAAQGG